MHKITAKKQKIIEIFLKRGKMQSSELHKELLTSGEDVSLVTVKRALSELNEEGILEMSGLGRSTSYELSNRGLVLLDIDAKKYVEVEPDKRFGSNQYNFKLLANFPVDIFTNEELERLEKATEK